MEQVIKQLLILQERDHQLKQLQAEVGSMEQQRRMLQEGTTATQGQLDAVRLKTKQIESTRKQSEMEVDGLKQQIAKYSLQQFQTKKNDEYRAIGQEIENCKAKIQDKEDYQLVLMEKAESAQKELAAATLASNKAKELMGNQLGKLSDRESNLKKQMDEIAADRAKLAESIDPSIRTRYDRIFKHKGEKAIAGVDRGVCAGCHMKLPPQVIIACQSHQELVSCTNCGRILYYSADMSVDFSDG